MRHAYVNGRYVPHAQARVHIEDRGYQFADGVYEVVPLRDGRMIDEAPHLDRLGRSLAALRIAWPMSRACLELVLRELVRRNAVADGSVYIQVTRGVAPRDHKFPRSPKPSLVATTKWAGPATGLGTKGVGVVTVPDVRWRRCDIKSINLLANVLAKQAAAEQSAFEAWQVDEAGLVTEGASTNAWIVTADGALRTRALDSAILAGVTRETLLGFLASEGLRVEERAFTVPEALLAPEAFLTSSSNFVLPVTRLDGKPIGDGRPGPITRRLRAWYLDRAGMTAES